MAAHTPVQESSSSNAPPLKAIARPDKHAAGDDSAELVPQPKRVHAEANVNPDDSETAVTEVDVGIQAYISPDLVPIEGGIIKQRYSDFHVHEVARGGSVCRITSLYPPTSEQGGSGLYETIRAQEAEREDKTGRLRQERIDKEADERKARDDERQAEQKRVAAQSWEWVFDAEQETKLMELLGSERLVALRTLWTQGPKRGGWADRTSVHSLPIASKEARTAAHQLIRTLFNGYLITETVEVPAIEGEATASSALRIRWGSGQPEQRRNNRHDDQQKKQSRTIDDKDAPPYIHFLMQKTNRDSQDALSLLARNVHLQHGSGGGGKALKELTLAGTKDKRGITVQQVAVRRGRKTLDEVWKLANGLGGGGKGKGPRGGGWQQRGLLDAVTSRGERGIRIGHLCYADEPLHLGQLGGNEFTIVLRNVKVHSHDVVDQAMGVLKTKGFINYFGMQRFGTSTISTHKIGIELLRNDFRAAIGLIMAPRQGDAEGVQEARTAYGQGKLDECLPLFPHFNVPERAIVSRMRADKGVFPVGTSPASVTGADWKKYFSALPRTLRTMYVHAYQSYVWNRITTERVHRYGVEKPVVGDYVLLSGNVDEVTEEEEEEAASERGDEDERANGPSAQASGFRKRVKLLETEEDVAQYTIHNVVVPMPGTSVHFPESSWAATVYRDILADDGLTPDNILQIGTKSPELALTGDYRALLHLPRNVSYDLVRYTDPNVNLVQSDEDKILGLETPPKPVEVGEEAAADQPSFLALVLRLTLGVSAYATMALREVLKQNTSAAHQRELTMRGEDRKPTDD